MDTACSVVAGDKASFGFAADYLKDSGVPFPLPSDHTPAPEEIEKRKALDHILRGPPGAGVSEFYRSPRPGPSPVGP